MDFWSDFDQLIDDYCGYSSCFDNDEEDDDFDITDIDDDDDEDDDIFSFFENDNY